MGQSHLHYVRTQPKYRTMGTADGKWQLKMKNRGRADKAFEKVCQISTMSWHNQSSGLLKHAACTGGSKQFRLIHSWEGLHQKVFCGMAVPVTRVETQGDSPRVCFLAICHIHSPFFGVCIPLDHQLHMVGTTRPTKL